MRTLSILLLAALCLVGGAAPAAAQGDELPPLAPLRSVRETYVLAFNGASTAMIDGLKLPVKNALAGVRQNDFYAPGSILAVELDRSHPVAKSFRASVPAIWFENGPAFEITDPSTATAVATYPGTGNPLLSGWLLGGDKLNGKAALVDVRRGKGHVVLFGFRPQYRGQSMATFPLIWNALRPIPTPVTKAMQ